MASFKGKMRFMRQLSYSIQRSFEQSHFNEKRLETFLRCKKLSDVMKTPIVSYATAPGISSVTRDSGYGSKYHPLSALERTEEKMREKFFNSKSFSYDKWEEIKLELMSECLILTEENFDSVLMNSLLYLNNYELATSFMQYLKQSKKRPNFVTYLKYMIVCSKNVEMCKQDTILDIYDKIKSQLISSPVLDNSTVDCIIQGLAVTDRWEESFEYLEKLPDNNPKLDTKNSLTYAALRNKNTEMAWDMLQNWYSKHEDPSNRVFIQYLKLVVKTFYFDKQEANLLLEKLFNYMISRNIVMKMSLVDQVADYFKMEKHAWIVNYSKVNRSGVCSSCNKVLEASMLSTKDFIELKEAFYQNSLRKVDSYFNTTDRELKHFLSFIEKMKPFDVVLDGLNAAYSVVGNRNKRTLSLQLLKVIRHLSLSHHRILVLGRNHMREWPFHVWEQIRKNAFVFFASNISEDDPFLIYATLASGPNAMFLSSDLMRDHAACLNDPVLLKMFKHWQLSHQIYLSTNDEGELKFTRPLKHHIAIQGNMNTGWHIPYDDEFILDPYEELNNWLCVQKSTQRESKLINDLFV